MRQLGLVILLSLLFCLPLAIRDAIRANPQSPKSKTTQSIEFDTRNWYRVVPKVIHDADTISKGDIELGMGVWLVDQSFRPDDFDAWEVSNLRSRGNPNIKITEQEIQQGKDAKKEFEGLCGLGTLYVSPNQDRPREKYGRILGPWVLVLSDGEVIRVADYAKSHNWVRSNTLELDRD